MPIDLLEQNSKERNHKDIVTSLHELVHHPAIKETTLRERVLLDLGRSGLGRGVAKTNANAHGRGKHMGMKGTHADDAKAERDEQEVIDRFLAHFKALNLSIQLEAELKDLVTTATTELKKLVNITDTLKASNAPESAAKLEPHKSKIRTFRETFKNLEARRKQAKTTAELKDISNDIQATKPEFEKTINSSRAARSVVENIDPIRASSASFGAAAKPGTSHNTQNKNEESEEKEEGTNNKANAPKPGLL